MILSSTKSEGGNWSSRRRLSTTASLSLLLAIVLMILAACGGSSTPNTSKPTHGGTLTIVDSPKGDFTSNFNPFISSQTSRYGTQGFLYETLIYVNRYTGQITDWLASNYQQSSDLKTVTFTIRQGVKWSDGSALTSDDVAFTLNVMKQQPALDLNGLWKNLIQSVATPDPNTVVVTLQNPSSTALWYIGGQTFIVQKKAFTGIANISTYTNDHPVATGPFTLKSFTPQLFVYARNPNYWQPGKPAIDEIHLPALDTNTTANLLLSRGDVDWAGVGYDPKLDPIYVNKDPAHNHTWFPASNVVTLYLNLKETPFNLLPVRQAISMLIDRNELKQKAAPYAPPASPTGLLPFNTSWVASQYANSSFSVNDAQAATLMQQAGYTKDGNGIYASGGKEISFKMDVVNGWSDWQSDTQLIADKLNSFGMKVSVNTLGGFTPYFTNLQNGSFDAAISWTNPGPTPYYLYESELDSQNTAPIGQAAPSNWERWSDATTDNLLKQYATSSDPNAQKQAIQGIEQIMVNQLPTIPLTYNPYWDEYTTKHFTGWPDQQNPYAVPSPTNYPDNEYIVLHLTPIS